MTVIPFDPQHIDRLEMHGSQGYMGQWVTPEFAKALAAHPSITVTADDAIVACGGVVEMWPGRFAAWALMSSIAGRRMVEVHRAARRLFDMCGAARIETAVDCEFPEGHRWIQMLGFELEAPRMRSYRPGGGDCALYARVP